MKCILIRGIPGSGKSTFATKTFPGIFHIENDMYHMKEGKYSFEPKRQGEAMKWCLDMCEKALTVGMDVVVSNTFTKPCYVDVYMKLAEKYKAEFIVYRMTSEFKNLHSVPVDILENMRKNMKDWPGELFVTPRGDTYSISKYDQLTSKMNPNSNSLPKNISNDSMFDSKTGCSSSP